MKDKRERVADEVLMVIPLLHKKTLHAARARSKLSTPYYLILCVLDREGPMPTTEVGKRLAVSKPNMTALADKLIDEKYVIRLPDKKDRRIVRLAQTAKGKRALEKWRKDSRESVLSALMPLDDKDLAALHEALKTMRAIMSKLEGA